MLRSNIHIQGSSILAMLLAVNFWYIAAQPLAMAQGPQAPANSPHPPMKQMPPVPGKTPPVPGKSLPGGQQWQPANAIEAELGAPPQEASKPASVPDEIDF
jgi:hypothetical protein